MDAYLDTDVKYLPSIAKISEKKRIFISMRKIILAVRFVYNSKSFFVLPVYAVLFSFPVAQGGRGY